MVLITLSRSVWIGTEPRALCGGRPIMIRYLHMASNQFGLFDTYVSSMPVVVSDWDPVVISCLLVLMASAHNWEIEVDHEKRKVKRE